jgi:MoaA/NifB/PqqE/SkfB family radical SAM enzyme
MATAGLLPQPDLEPGAAGRFLTFIVPAVTGCNLKCPFCVVRQREEIADADLRPEDFARFIREAAERAPIFALAIQGYEPLLTSSLSHTQAILATGRFLGVPTTLVTNGVNLINAIDLLKTLSLDKIAVSLDAASAHIHDRIRGVTGAWAASVEGIRRAREMLAPRTRLVVSSVLLPSRRHYLEAMPSLLRDIGIDRWIINPLLQVGRAEAGGPVADRADLFRDVLVLQKLADRAGVRMTVDDEFNHLDHGAACAAEPFLRALDVRTLPPRVEIFRLTPSGQCSVGDDILRRVSPDTPRWRPEVLHAGDFLDMLSKPTTASQQQGLALPHIT